jgi:3-phosphoshikimate 1-carboxyvinyltransferase
MHAYPPTLEVVPLTNVPNCAVSVPGSKSITNRALVLAALGSRTTGCRLTGVLRSEDTEVMLHCLTKLGFGLTWIGDAIDFSKNESGRLIPAASADLYVANSGTTIRFLTAMLAAGQGRYRLSGVPRMHERPIGDLLDALRQLGVSASSEAGNGCPPVVIETSGLRGGSVRIRADVSSQYLSALMMAAPSASAPVQIVLEGSTVSEPYIAMTERMVAEFNSDYAIEPDASAASYFFAVAAITGGRILVRGMKRDMLQGDVLFVDALARMGCVVTESSEGIAVEGRPLRGIDIDMNAISDTMMTLAAVACFAEGPTTIRNVAHVRHKETDRIAAMAAELRKLGATVDEFADGLTITPGALHGAPVETYRDHRMAMSLALVGLKVPGVVIGDPGCVAKTYPGFWQDLDALRA